MKKALSLLLALVMCLSLCACGKDETIANPYEKYSALFDMLEAGKYEDAHGYIDDLADTTEPSITEPSVSEPSESEPALTTIEINQDNWDQYFEFKPYISNKENSFGEFEHIARCGDAIQVKEEYVGRIIEYVDLAVEVEFGEAIVYCVEYNTTTQLFSLSRRDDMQVRNYGDSSTLYAKGGIEDYKITSPVTEIANFSLYTAFSSDAGQLSEDVFSCYACLASSYEVVRIEGKITIES